MITLARCFAGLGLRPNTKFRCYGYTKTASTVCCQLEVKHELNHIMEFAEKLQELNMTVEEINRLTKALKDEKFKEMLRDYAEELSDPENKKRYEEEIKLLEQERGNTIEFLHPQPFRALRTSMNGKQKCFINICANEKVGKPASKWEVSEEGHRGQCWSLPHSLHPGRQDTDTKGNKIMIYDVIFHPDTLHIASKNKRFMDMVVSTAMEGIQSAFKVTLDKNNVREMSTKYKGTPQPCVIRKPIPGYTPKDPSEKPDILAFPYPDEKQSTTSAQAKPAESPKSFQIQPKKPKEPTKPNYTVKYRSFIDLQNFRYSRDSAQSPRPKEIVVTIDVPLLKVVADASLEVKEGQLLLLESKKPAYRLELPLAYPVDEDKGDAKFNKQRGQLIVTLPVLPSNEAFDLAVGPASVSDGVRQEEKNEVEEEDSWKEERSNEKARSVEEEGDIEEEDLKQQTRIEKGEEEKREMRERENSEKDEIGTEEEEMKEERDTKEEDLKLPTRVEKCEEEKMEMRERENGEKEETGVGVEAKWEKQIRKGQKSVEVEKQENKEEAGKLNQQKRQQNADKLTSKYAKVRPNGYDRAADTSDSGARSFQCDTVPSENENSCVAAPKQEKQPILVTAEHLSDTAKEEEVNQNSCLESEPKTKTSDMKEETEKTRETPDANPTSETDPAFLHHRPSEAVSSTPAKNNLKDCCISQPTEECSKVQTDERTDETNKSSRGCSGKRVTVCPEERATGKQEEKENIDEDDLPTEQIFQNSDHDDNSSQSVLREIDEDGNEKVISDHSTSAGFVFQNSLMYELD